MKKNYAAWDLPRHSKNSFAALNTRNKLVYLCALGHLAPSTHNTQPWKFFVDEKSEKITVYVDKKLILPASDVCGRQSLISVGCALANIETGAEQFGYKIKFLYHSVAPRDVTPKGKNFAVSAASALVRVATLSFYPQKNTKNSDGLFESIFTRKVARAEFDPEKNIPKQAIREITTAVSENSAKLIVISDRLRRLALSEFQGQADNYVLNSEAFARELGSWLLPNDSASYLGMPGSTFGLKNEESIRLHEGLLGKKTLEPDDALRFSLAGKMGIEKSPFIGLITTAKDDAASWLNAGRAFEKAFLILNERGISVAIHAGIVEVSLINKIFAASLGTLRKILVLFRAGYPKRKEDAERPHSPRLPLNKILLNKAPLG